MTSIPASRNARATTFAPRSWPSRPGFAMSTRIFFGMGSSVEQRLLPDAEDLAHHVADLAERRLRAHRVEDERHRIVVAFTPGPKPLHRAGVLLRVPNAADPAEPLELSPERRLGDAEWLDLGLLVDDEVVDADDDPFAEFAISCWKNPFRIAGITPPRPAMRSK